MEVVDPCSATLFSELGLVMLAVALLFEDLSSRPSSSVWEATRPPSSSTFAPIAASNVSETT